MTATSQEGAKDSGRHVEGGSYQPTDVAPRNVLYMAGLLIAGILLSIALVAGLFVLLERYHRPPSRTGIERAVQIPPSPRLQVSPWHDREMVEQRAKPMLVGYDWTNKAAGRVRVPIERAMDMVASQGWPEPAQESAP